MLSVSHAVYKVIKCLKVPACKGKSEFSNKQKDLRNFLFTYYGKIFYGKTSLVLFSFIMIISTLKAY